MQHEITRTFVFRLYKFTVYLFICFFISFLRYLCDEAQARNDAGCVSRSEPSSCYHPCRRRRLCMNNEDECLKKKP